MCTLVGSQPNLYPNLDVVNSMLQQDNRLVSQPRARRKVLSVLGRLPALIWSCLGALVLLVLATRGYAQNLGQAVASEIAGAATPQAAGHLLASAADVHDSGYVDMQVDLQMVLNSANGRSTLRELSIRQLEVPSDGDKLLVVFSTPKSVKGTALLSYAHKEGQDDQWLYLPAIKRVKKIASKNRSGPFLSSEFAFEDLTPQEVDKYEYELLDSQPCGAGRCYVLQRVAKDQYTGYSRQEQWLDQTHLLTQKIDYFDRRGDLLKSLQVSGYELFDEQHWRALNLMMTNHQSGKSTELTWSNYRFNTGLDADRDFSANSLRRVR